MGLYAKAEPKAVRKDVLIYSRRDEAGKTVDWDVSAGSDGKRGDPMAEWDKCAAVERLPNKVSGAWVFRGTRVPVSALFENLRAGASIEEFLDWFEGVDSSQVKEVLDHELKSLSVSARS